MADKKYYWLKLQKDFFKRHDIRIIENMPNGKDYVLFYLKLLVESIDHEGQLRFSETIPYNEEMLATITNTNVDIVRSAMKAFSELKMIDILDDATIFMAETSKMIGFETKWAEKKREYRAKKDNILALSDICPNNVRQEKEIELEKELDIDINKGGVGENYSYEKNSNINNFFQCLETHKENEYINSNPDLMNCLKDWFEYKDSKKPKANNHYGTKLGMEKLLKKVVDKCKEYGVQAVVETINDTIANNYQGIVWNWLEKKRGNYGNTKPERRNARRDDVEIDPEREEILAFWREQEGMQ